MTNDQLNPERALIGMVMASAGAYRAVEELTPTTSQTSATAHYGPSSPTNPAKAAHTTP